MKIFFASSTSINEDFQKLSAKINEQLLTRYEMRRSAIKAEQQEEEKKEKEGDFIMIDVSAVVQQSDNIVETLNETNTSYRPVENALEVQQPLEFEAQPSLQVETAPIKSEEKKLEEIIPLTNYNDTIETTLLSDLGILKTNCERLPITQKEFIECLFFNENEFMLSVYSSVY